MKYSLYVVGNGGSLSINRNVDAETAIYWANKGKDNRFSMDTDGVYTGTKVYIDGEYVHQQNYKEIISYIKGQEMMDGLDVRSFLMGYFYTAVVTYNQKSHFFREEYDQISHQDKYDMPEMVTKSGRRLMFAINRGIAPRGGRVKYAFDHVDDSTFDVVKEWCDQKVWGYVKEFYPEPANEFSEVRLNFQELIDVIENA